MPVSGVTEGMYTTTLHLQKEKATYADPVMLT